MAADDPAQRVAARRAVSEPKCSHVADDQPRILPGRHATTCPDKQPRPHGAPHTDTCQGCEPCTQPHCLSCGHRHAPVTCAHCTGLARTELWRIVTLDHLVDAEVRRGSPSTDSETVMLDGPAAHPEAWYHVADSVRAGRIRGDIEANRHEDHPLWVLGWWEIAWRDHLDHDTTDRISVFTAAQYLDDHLTAMANRLEPPFAQFAEDLSRCRGHLEDVLHDRDPKPKDCPKCGGPLVLDYDEDGKDAGYEPGNEEKAYDDRWKCKNRACRQWWTDHDYRTKVEAVYGLHAPMLPVTEMAMRTGVVASTIRRWAGRQRVVGEDGKPEFMPPLLRTVGRSKDGRRMYRVTDVEHLAGRTRVASA